MKKLIFNNKEKLTNKIESLWELDNNFSEIVNKTEIDISRVTEDVLSGNIDIIQSTRIMQRVSENVVMNITEILAKHLSIPVSELPVALFFFGSQARNLMLPNSDLDIGLVYEKSCNGSLKEYLEEQVNLLPFDKIDIADWRSVDEMTEKNCISMIKYNASVDAKYITGNTCIASEHKEKVVDKDTKEAKIKRFITEFGILHLYDYKNKKTDHGEDLKYVYIGSRDIIFLDWYYGIYSELSNSKDKSVPFYERGLEILERQQIISSEEGQELRGIIEIILLVKFTLLSKFKENGDQSFLYSSKKSLDKCYLKGENAFNNIGIKSGDELFDRYFNSRIKLDNLVKTLKNKMLDKDKRTRDLWNSAESQEFNVEEVNKLLVNNEWQDIIPFAIHSSSNKVLFGITNRIKDLGGYEYILRIISQNDSIQNDTINILLDSRLPEKYKEKLINK